MKATGVDKRAHESGFIVCKPDINFRMSIAHCSKFLLRFTSVHSSAFLTVSFIFCGPLATGAVTSSVLNFLTALPGLLLDGPFVTSVFLNDKDQMQNTAAGGVL
jgi:hypothetical protein